MVISAENPRQPPDPMAARTPPRPPPRAETQSHLHNFSFPILKKWGSQRVLRCLNVNRKGELIKSPPPISRSEAPDPEKDDGALEQVREKLLVHLREAADRVKVPEPAGPLPEPKSSPPESAPWNLRTRKAVIMAPTESPSPPPQAARSREEMGGSAGPNTRTVRLRSEDVEKKERPRFSISLTREEIDEDFYALTGSRARRRPKKRPRAVQKKLDMMFPGSWLTEITADSYKVSD